MSFSRAWAARRSMKARQVSFRCIRSTTSALHSSRSSPLRVKSNWLSTTRIGSGISRPGDSAGAVALPPASLTAPPKNLPATLATNLALLMGFLSVLPQLFQTQLDDARVTVSNFGANRFRLNVVEQGPPPTFFIADVYIDLGA